MYDINEKFVYLHWICSFLIDKDINWKFVL